MEVRMKFSLKIMVITLTFAFLIFTGCFSNEKTDSSSPSVTPTELEGSWKNSCTYDLPNDESSYIILTLSGSMYTYVASIFEQDACLSPNLLIVFTETGTFSIGDEIMTQTNPEPAKKLDITTSSYRATPKSQAVTDWLNDNSYCGIDTWALNVPTDVTGLMCDGDLSPSAGDISYTIYAISGGNTLYFGDDSTPYEGISEATRPVDLDKTNPLTKQ